MRTSCCDYRTGGPPRRDHVYPRERPERTFCGREIRGLEDYGAEIQEDQAHNGMMSALIDLVARKP